MLFPCFLLLWETSEEENTEYIHFNFAFASLGNVILRGSILCFLYDTPIAEMEVVQQNHVFKAWMLSLQLKTILIF